MHMVHHYFQFDLYLSEYFSSPGRLERELVGSHRLTGEDTFSHGAMMIIIMDS